MDYGIRISRDGYDVKTCTDKQCSMISKYKTFTVVTSGIVNLTISTGQYRNGLTITHGLGYVPAFKCFGFDPASNTTRNVPFILGLITGSVYTIYSWVDNTKIYFEIQSNTGAASENDNVDVKYYIFNNIVE
jgi:hypothetical protein